MSLRIKEVIKVKGISIQELAKRMGISRVGLSQHINGNPSVEVLERIASALQVPVTDLFDQPSNDTVNCPYCGGVIKIGKRE
jgi:transcriptional regulator with XRE-family HTH domain